MAPIADDILDEAVRVTDRAQASGVVLRVIGGVAVALHAAHPMPPALARSHRDIDLVTTRGGGRQALGLLAELGYESNQRFNAMNGGRRLVVYDRSHGRQIDVFVGEFRMCHAVPIADRLELEARTVPLAELLLTKLQIARLNRKDIQDVLAILLEHDVGEHDYETINAEYIASLLCGDWGLWRTATGSINSIGGFLPESGLTESQQETIRARFSQLHGRIAEEPKSLRWRARARIGDRMTWYEMPEEIEHADLGKAP